MRTADRGRVRIAALCVCVGSAWGCAANEAAAPAGAAPGPAVMFESREPATIEEAQAQLERARAQLPGWAPPTTPVTGASVETPGAGGTTQSAESGPSTVPREVDTEPQHRCGNACGAMTSMRHAVEAICRMAGEADARCTDARKTLRDSEVKVAGCGCPPP